jgi:hypothetical protein
LECTGGYVDFHLEHLVGVQVRSWSPSAPSAPSVVLGCSVLPYVIKDNYLYRSAVIEYYERLLLAFVRSNVRRVLVLRYPTSALFSRLYSHELTRIHTCNMKRVAHETVVWAEESGTCARGSPPRPLGRRHVSRRTASVARQTTHLTSRSSRCCRTVVHEMMIVPSGAPSQWKC